MTRIMDGNKVSQDIRGEIKEKTAQLKGKGIIPGLAVVLVGDDPASQIYVKRKENACHEVGFYSREYKIPAETHEKDLLNLIGVLNADQKIHGILVQLPLPSHINSSLIIEAIDPQKDVDGFHPVNVGRLLTGQPCQMACTPKGIMVLLERYGISLAGKEAVIVGRSNIVGKPLFLMLLAQNATVTVCHTKTKDLAEVTCRADILIAAAGKAEIVRGDMVREGAVVIDVGINRLDNGKLAGDVSFAEVSPHCAFITPVPGGVGPMTIAMLLHNTLKAAEAGLEA
ncbi:MAG: bifunctional methylenetetrahydrofolate dehydrogenase/methenyltetrahydrofolate cyclohydrolase FolD [Syntrophobacterales bacterium]|jgi:methylenetetrahydrofolate dehydrogenase (NADP+)/methenyltetrahydrofolate cyclohydrolase|nr:bifunctional methylenetetrahydrofolate dehydrogenase/methenyltetrahydrofolate cyclohydrolase FolD [Syntrophobacterales bacterium]